MTNPFQFSVELGATPPEQRRQPGDPLRILVLSDLGTSCRSRTGDTLETRAMRRLDVDALETLLKDEAPRLNLPAGPFAPREIDDFDADQLVQSFPVFQALKDLRSRLIVPATFDKAAEEVRAVLQASGETAQDAVPGRAETDTDTLSRLFGQTSEAGTASGPPDAGGYIDRLLRDAVADHVVEDAEPGAEPYVQAVDAAAADHLRAILHDPSFQSLEAAWRGLDLLASNIETDEELSIHVWNVGKSELQAALGPEGQPLDQTLLHRRIVAEYADAPFTLIMTDGAFEDTTEDLRLLASLGALAGRTGAAVLVNVDAQLIGAPSWHAIANAPEAFGDASDGWTALQSSPMGQHIVALGPKFLMRTSYGKRRDPVDAFFDFEEVQDPATDYEAFLWGAPSLVATVLIARAFREDGWNTRLDSALTYGDLPLVSFEAGGVPVMKPCAEAPLSERVAEAVLERGVVPLVALRNQNAVRLPWLRTMSRAGETRVVPFLC